MLLNCDLCPLIILPIWRNVKVSLILCSGRYEWILQHAWLALSERMWESEKILNTKKHLIFKWQSDIGSSSDWDMTQTLSSWRINLQVGLFCILIFRHGLPHLVRLSFLCTGQISVYAILSLMALSPREMRNSNNLPFQSGFVAFIITVPYGTIFKTKTFKISTETCLMWFYRVIFHRRSCVFTCFLQTSRFSDANVNPSSFKWINKSLMNVTPNKGLVCDFSASSVRQEKCLLVDVISCNSFSWAT